MSAATRRGDWIQTFSGRQFWPLDPRAEDVCIEDIAHALSMQCRFAGHTRLFYSVAEHALRVAALVPNALRRAARLHDAAEAYILDMPRPLKKQPLFEGYREAERGIIAVIAARFSLPPDFFMDPAIKHADAVLLATEARDLMGRPPNAWAPMPAPLPARIEPWSQQVAEQRFLEAFND